MATVPGHVRERASAREENIIINPTSNVPAEELAWIIAEFQRTEFELDTWHRERQAVLDDVAIIVEAPVQVKQKFAKFVSLHALLQHVEDEAESG